VPTDEIIQRTSEPAPRIGLRERKKMLVQTTIEDAALRLFEERGYEETSIQDIADAVVMSPRTFFRYFASKEEVLFAPTHAAFDATITFLQQTSPIEPLSSTLYATFAYLASLYQQRSARFLVINHIARATPTLMSGSLYYLATLEPTLCEAFTTHRETQMDEYQMLLLVATAMTAFRVALQVWLEQKTQSDLVALVHEHLERLLEGQLLSNPSL
jgi:AcrR family transcriptional regulator